MNEWSHVAGVYDGKQVRLYIKGKLQESADVSGERTTNDHPLFVGADPDGFGNPTREFAGQIDEVRVSTSARYTDDFEPSQRFESDKESLLLLHMDQAVGPFLLHDGEQKMAVIRSGRAEISQKK